MMGKTPNLGLTFVALRLQLSFQDPQKIGFACSAT